MFCSNCSSRISDGERVCPVCGAVVGGGYTPPVNQNVPPTPPYTPPTPPYTPPVNPNVPPYTPPGNTYMMKNQGLGVGRILLTVLLSIVIFVIGTATTGLAFMRFFVSSGLTDSIIDNADWAEIAGFDEEINIDEAEEITKKITKKIVNQFTDYMLGGDEPEGISAEDVEEILSLYADELGEDIDPEAYSEIVSYYSEEAFEMALEEAKESEDWQIIENMRTVLSLKTLLTFVAILLVLILLLAVVQKGFIGTMRVLGIVSIVTSVPYLILFTVGKVFGNIALSYAEDEMYKPMISAVFSRMTMLFIAFGAVMLVGGIAVIIIGGSLKKRKNSMLR